MLPMILLMFLLSRWSGGLVKRYGGGMPLMVGPVIVATGFVLFAVVHTGNNYWKTYFPASLVFGLGMAITVAPLTTVVMNSVDQRHAGTASGINNAIARLAGVLALAIFGSVMVKGFDAHLERSLTNLMLPPSIVQDIRSREVELAALEPPEDLDGNTVVAIRRAISESFVSGFRIVLFCCAGLSMGSVVVAWRLIAPAAIAGNTLVPDKRATR
jgi:MFS family permease